MHYSGWATWQGVGPKVGPKVGCISITINENVQNIFVYPKHCQNFSNRVGKTPALIFEVCHTECDVPVPGIFNFFGGIGTGIGKNWYRKKVSEPVSEKIGTGKKSQNRYRKNLVLKKSTGIGIENIWYRKKVSVSVSVNILGTVTLWHTCNMLWVAQRA